MKVQPAMTPDELVQLARVRNLCASGLNRTIRLAADLSLAEVAHACDMTVATLCRWEAGNQPTGRRPYGANALRYGELLERLASGGPIPQPVEQARATRVEQARADRIERLELKLAELRAS